MDNFLILIVDKQNSQDISKDYYNFVLEVDECWNSDEFNEICLALFKLCISSYYSGKKEVEITISACSCWAGIAGAIKAMIELDDENKEVKDLIIKERFV